MPIYFLTQIYLHNSRSRSRSRSKNRQEEEEQEREQEQEQEQDQAQWFRATFGLILDFFNFDFFYNFSFYGLYVTTTT